MRLACGGRGVQALVNQQQHPLYPLGILICSPYLFFQLGFWGELHYFGVQGVQRREFGGEVSLYTLLETLGKTIHASCMSCINLGCLSCKV